MIHIAWEFQVDRAHIAEFEKNWYF